MSRLYGTRETGLTMADALPRLSIIDLICTTYRIYRMRLKFFIGVSIIGPLLAAVYPFLFWLYRTDGGTRQQPALSWLPTIVGTLVATALMLLGSMVSSALVVRSVADIKNCAQTLPPQQQPQTRIWSVAGIVFSVLMQMLVAGVLFAIVGAGVLGVAAALRFNSPVVAGAIGFAVAGGWLLGIILSSISIYARNAVAMQSCVLERIGRRAAMKRSALLTTGDRDRVSNLYCAFMIFSCAIVLGEFMLLPRTNGIAMWIVEAATVLVAGALVAPFWTIGMVLIYCEEREQARAIAA